MNILILDDHHLFNDGLKIQLTKYENIKNVYQLYDGKLIQDFLKKEKAIDILLLDLKIENLNGFDIAKQVLLINPKIKILVISVYAQVYQIDELKSVGVKGFISKISNIDEVYKGILKIMEGGEYFNHKILKKIDNEVDEFTKKNSLTKREIELVNLLLLGKTNSQIAEAMQLSIHTIVAHRKNIHVKLEVKNERDLIKFAIENGIK